MSLFYVQFLSGVDPEHVRGRTDVKLCVEIQSLNNRSVPTLLQSR